MSVNRANIAYNDGEQRKLPAECWVEILYCTQS